MLALVLVLLLALLLFGLGFTAHVLFIVAAVVLLIWVVGLVVGHRGGGRFYGW